MARLEAGQIVPEHPDPAVVPLDLGIVRDAAQRRVEGSRRYAVADRNLLERIEPLAEPLRAMAAILGAGGRGQKDGRRGGENQRSQNLSPNFRPILDRFAGRGRRIGA